MAEMIQWGMSLDHVFMVNGNKHTFADFVRSFQNERQHQPQETAGAELGGADHCRALGSAPLHQNGPKQLRTRKLSLEDIVRYEIDDPISATTTCGGTHRLFRPDLGLLPPPRSGGKKEGVWLETVEYLDKYKKQARDFQNKDGYLLHASMFYEPNSEGDVEAAINTTGHVLEWLSLYLADDELREPWMLDAVGVLTGMLLQNANRSFDGGSYYHAAHALEIYRTRVFGAADSHPPVIPPRPKD